MINFILMISALCLGETVYGQKREAADKYIKKIMINQNPITENIPIEVIVFPSGKYKGNVEYQMVCKGEEGEYIQVGEHKSINGWSYPLPCDSLYKISLEGFKFKEGINEFYLRVKRSGYSGKNKSELGSYDYQKKFVIEYRSKNRIKVNCEFEIRDDIFKVSSKEKDIEEYRIFIYDFKKDSWKTMNKNYADMSEVVLTEFDKGRYIIDIWHRKKGNTKYDGWILKLIDKDQDKSEEVFNLSEDDSHSAIQKKLVEYIIASEENRIELMNQSVRMNYGDDSNTCVYYISEGLRRNGLKVPKVVCNTGSIYRNPKNKRNLTHYLLTQGWKYSKDLDSLKPGDICFTTPRGGGNGLPTHTYVFLGWINENKKYALISDNQGEEYGGHIHIRNINFPTKDKEAFYYFMYKEDK